MVMKPKYFLISGVREVEPGTIMTAAMIHCIGCGEMLSGMGGGAAHICCDCLDEVKNGALRKDVKAPR